MNGFVIATLLLTAPEAVTDEKPTILVAPLKAVGVSTIFAEILTEDLRTFVGRSDQFALVTPEEMAAIDKELARQLSGGCDEASCIAELGGALGAQLMATGIVSKVGERLSVNVKLIDIATVTAKRVSARRASSIEVLQDQMAPLVAELLGDKPQVQRRAKSKGIAWTPNQRMLVAIGSLTGILGGAAVGLINLHSNEPTLKNALVADSLILSGVGVLVYFVANLPENETLGRQRMRLAK